MARNNLPDGRRWNSPGIGDSVRMAYIYGTAELAGNSASVLKELGCDPQVVVHPTEAGKFAIHVMDIHKVMIT